MSALVSTLSAEEMREVEALAGLGLQGNLPNLAPPPRRAAGKKTVITYAELVEMREAGVTLEGLYVRLTDGTTTGLVEAAKVLKWTVKGWEPVT